MKKLEKKLSLERITKKTKTQKRESGMLTTIFYHVDNFCKKFASTEIEKNEKRGRKRSMSLSEIMTIAIFFHYSKMRTFKDYYNLYIKGINRSCFNRVVSYNRFVELMQKIAMPLMLFQMICLKNTHPSKIFFIDSCSLVVSHNRRIYSHKVFKGVSKRGKTSTGWFFGFKLHLVINQYAQVVACTITPGNIADNDLGNVDFMTKHLKGLLFGDRGYISQKLFEQLLAHNLKLFTKIKKNMKNKLVDISEKLMLRKRGIIETVFNVLKTTFHIEHSRHRCLPNFIVNLVSGLIAYFFKPQKPSLVRSRQMIA